MRIQSALDLTNVCEGLIMPNGDCVSSCPVGHACKDGQVIPCESGTFSGGGDASECTVCDDDAYCPAESPIPYVFPDHLFKKCMQDSSGNFNQCQTNYCDAIFRFETWVDETERSDSQCDFCDWKCE